MDKWLSRKLLVVGLLVVGLVVLTTLVCVYLMVAALVMVATGHQVWPWEGVQGFNVINGGQQVTYPK